MFDIPVFSDKHTNDIIVKSYFLSFPLATNHYLLLVLKTHDKVLH